MSKLAAVLSSVLLAFACEGEAEVSPRAAEPGTEGTARPTAEHATESAEAPALALGRPAVTLGVPAPPGFALTIAENGEYQIDVTAEGEVNPSVHLYRGDTFVEADDDSGEDDNARIVRFLEPGAYSIRISEHDARPFTASVRATRLEPLEASATTTIGPGVDVPFPALPELRRAETEREAARSVALTVEREGDYACIARMDNGRIARMQLIQNGTVLGADEQRFTELAATVTHHFTPGTYEVRVWDAEYRGDMRATVMCDPAGD